MRWRNIFAIVKKDLLEVRQNKAVWMPMIIAPSIFIVLFPLIFLILPQYFPDMMSELSDESEMAFFLDNIPLSMMKDLQGLDALQKTATLMLGYMFSPMFLIFPLAFATVVAAESFAGERERKTLEALLYTPATENELFWGKVITGMIPALAVSWGSFVAYGIVLNAAGYPLFNRLWFPLPSWYPLIFWITPALALLGVGVTVLISARNQTFMGAYQSSSALVMLVLVILAGQLSGVVFLTFWTGMLLGLVLWLVSAGIIHLARRGFTRALLLQGKKGE
jgi:ABC-2 type transport system permease protein